MGLIKPPIPSHGDCSLCDWDTYQDSDDMAKLLSVLHVLTKHPEKYQEITGNDPDSKLFEYREYIRVFEREL